MKNQTSPPKSQRTRFRGFVAVCSLVLASTASAMTDHPRNLGNGLDKVVARELAAKAGKPIEAPGTGSAVDAGDRAMHDAQGRLLVTVYLQQQSASRAAVGSVKDIQVNAEDMTYQGGAMDVYVPVERVNELATTPGVSAVFLALAPVSNHKRRSHRRPKSSLLSVLD